MKSGVNEFTKVALLAPTNLALAAELCESISDDLYRCKGFTVVAHYTQTIEKKTVLLNRALKEGGKIKRHIDRGLALIWPLRLLAELKHDKLVLQTTHKILFDVKSFTNTTDYLELLNMMVGALCISSKAIFTVLYEAIRKECTQNSNNKIDVFLSRITPIVYKIDAYMANDLIFLIAGEAPRKQAEKRIQQETNFKLEDYFLDLQFKEI